MKGIQERKTKNGEIRYRVQIRVKGILHPKNSSAKKQNINYLFPSNDGSKPIDLRFPWEKALKNASITNFKFHDLRHSAASFLLMSGTTLAETSKVLGYKSLEMIKRYGHLSETHTASVVLRMNEKIFGSAR